MEPLIKQATLIDVLGILFPGGILILAVNFYGWWDVGAPWKALLGEGELSLLIYFVALSYLCGSVVHQLGAIIEEWLTKRPLRKINMHKKYWQDEEIQNAYRTYFRKASPHRELRIRRRCSPSTADYGRTGSLPCSSTKWKSTATHCFIQRILRYEPSDGVDSCLYNRNGLLEWKE